MKNWTVLIYANGNNDLEPEMQQALDKLEQVIPGEDTNIIVQIGKAKHELVKILRTNLPQKNDKKHLSGVRRYELDKEKWRQMQNLGNKNMADPKCLYEFIKWGMQNYPAKRYMLILSGHGFQFVGVMTDYSKKAPYIMGIPEMTQAINKAANETGNQIDLLLLDVCYFNFFESVYELGKEENHAVQNMITNIYGGPLEGLPYHTFLQEMKQKTFLDMKDMVKTLMNNIPYELIAFQINHAKFKEIKSLFNELALEYWRNNPNREDVNIKHVLFTNNPQDCWYSLAQKTLNEMLSTVICTSKSHDLKFMPVSVANITTSNTALISRYHRLGFAQNNHWTYLLSNKTFNPNNDPIQLQNELHPLRLTPREVNAYISIMNPGLTKDHKKKMINELYRYNKWKV